MVRDIMFILELLVALFVSLVLSAVFALATWKRGKRKGLVWLFLIIFFATWAGGLWMRPFGPTLWGIHWLTFLLVGVVVALILAVSQARPKPRGRDETIEMLENMRQRREAEQVAWITLTIFFWVLLLALLSAIVFRYLI
jgi:Ca2+/Na+ antiporter